MSTQLKSIDTLEDELDKHKLEWDNWFEHSVKSDELNISLSEREENRRITEQGLKIVSAKGEKYLEACRNKIEFEWLGHETYEEIPEYVKTAWNMTFPFGFLLSWKIVQNSMRIPKDNVRELLFPLNPPSGGPREKLFDALCAFGRGLGLSVVGGELFNGARSGDPRAVKMYLDLMTALGQEENIMGGVLFDFKIDR